MKRQAVQVRYEFSKEEDVREIFLRSFRLFLIQSLAEGIQSTVQLP